MGDFVKTVEKLVEKVGESWWNCSGESWGKAGGREFFAEKLGESLRFSRVFRKLFDKISTEQLRRKSRFSTIST